MLNVIYFLEMSREPLNSSLSRILHLIRDLLTHPQGILKKEIAEKYGVSIRTVDRYLERLERMFWYPVVRERTPEGTLVKLMPEYISRREPHYPPDPMDHFLLEIAHAHLSYLKYFAGIKSFEVFDRVKKIIKAQELSYPKIYIHHEAPAFSKLTEKDLITLIRALKEERKIKVIQENGEQEVMEPYTLILYTDEIYILGKCKNTDKLCLFNLVDVQEISILQEKFRYPSNLDVKAIFSSSFELGLPESIAQKIKLKFYPPVSKFIAQRQWHHSQKIYFHKNGSITLEMRVCPDQSLIRWIAGFGPYVKVQSPEKLKIDLVKYLKDALKKY